MGSAGKRTLREVRDWIGRRLGRRTDGRRVAAEGRTARAEARLLRTRDEILETVAEARRRYGARR